MFTMRARVSILHLEGGRGASEIIFHALEKHRAIYTITINSDRVECSPHVT